MVDDDMKMEALIPVIKGEIPLKAHAHAAVDLITALRIAKEFGVKITLEHVTEGHLIVKELVEANVPLAVGPTLTNASPFSSVTPLQTESYALMRTVLPATGLLFSSHSVTLTIFVSVTKYSALRKKIFD